MESGYLRAAAVQKETNQRIAAGDGQQEDLLPHGGFFDPLFAFARNAGLFLRDEHGRVLRKINAAFIAGPAMPLGGRAGRAFEEQGSVAATAESLCVAVRRLTLGAFHTAILARSRGTLGRAEPHVPRGELFFGTGCASDSV